MELNDIKNVWAQLDERLERQESLKSQIIKEMLQSKSSRSLSRLLNYEIFCLVPLVVFLPVLIYVDGRFGLSHLQHIMIYVFVGMFVLSMASQLWKIWLLATTDLFGPIAGNIRNIQRFRIHINREKLLSLLVIPFIVIFVAEAVRVQQGGIEAWRWSAIVVALLFVAIMAVFVYKRFYKSNIDTILKSMEELKELDEK